jgi:uncharacterized protein (TIGR02271 family)
MSIKMMSDYNNRNILKSIIFSGFIGGFFGAIVTLLHVLNILSIPIVGNMFFINPFRATVTVILLGAIIGGIIGVLISFNTSSINANSDQVETINNTDTETKLRLREEKLDIYKRLIKTGEVSIRKEFITEEKTIVVPLTREELIIEKKNLEKNSSKKNNNENEVIRIPINEERFEIVKHKAALEDVSVYLHQFQDRVHIDEILKKEMLKIETEGNAKVLNKVKSHNNNRSDK